MKMITDDDVVLADDRAEIAAETYRKARRMYPGRGQDELTRAAVDDARGTAERHAAHATQLREARRQLLAELAARDGQEAEAAEYLTAACRELDTSRIAVAAAMAKAEAALAEAYRVAAEHDALIAWHAGQVAALGLVEVDGVDFPTTTVVSGVQIRGQRWPAGEGRRMVDGVPSRVAAKAAEPNPPARAPRMLGGPQSWALDVVALSTRGHQWVLVPRDQARLDKDNNGRPVWRTDRHLEWDDVKKEQVLV